MNISRFGIGFRFDSIENGDEREHAFNLIFRQLKGRTFVDFNCLRGISPLMKATTKTYSRLHLQAAA